MGENCSNHTYASQFCRAVEICCSIMPSLFVQNNLYTWRSVQIFLVVGISLVLPLPLYPTYKAHFIFLTPMRRSGSSVCTNTSTHAGCFTSQADLDLTKVFSEPYSTDSQKNVAGATGGKACPLPHDSGGKAGPLPHDSDSQGSDLR